MAKIHPKHRTVAKAIISHPLYQAAKAKSKTPHRFDLREDSVVCGLHIFEWAVILVVVAVATLLIVQNESAAIKAGGSFCCNSAVR